jgi:hypothetical protein
MFLVNDHDKQVWLFILSVLNMNNALKSSDRSSVAQFSVGRCADGKSGNTKSDLLQTRSKSHALEWRLCVRKVGNTNKGRKVALSLLFPPSTSTSPANFELNTRLNQQTHIQWLAQRSDSSFLSYICHSFAHHRLFTANSSQINRRYVTTTTPPAHPTDFLFCR